VAAGLASFLKEKSDSALSTHSSLPPVAIHRWDERSLFVQCGTLMFRWDDDVPGAAIPRDAKWRMLVDWVNTHPTTGESAVYLAFTPSGVSPAPEKRFESQRRNP
jgi:hypothetical protein